MCPPELSLARLVGRALYLCLCLIHRCAAQTIGPSDNLSSDYTSSRLADLWSGITVATAPDTAVATPTPISTLELIDPPNLPELDQSPGFPGDFLWGFASSAPQIEGAIQADSRGPSIWDVLAHKHPAMMANGSQSFDITTNHYYAYKQDALRLKALGIRAYGLTISWPRLFPLGTGSINKVGLDHYVDEIKTLVALGIEPIVTLYHWDLPQELQLRYGGWLAPDIVADFGAYAKAVFDALAPLGVKTWITLNEPQIICQDYADFADPSADGVPDSVFPVFGIDNAQIRKYTCGHHALLAHATAAKYFHDHIRPTYGGGVSFANSWGFTPPLDPESDDDRYASQRSLDFWAGWFGNPVYVDGDYPRSMRFTLGPLLPKFTREQRDLVLGSTDFYAWDAYSGYPVRAPAKSNGGLAQCMGNTSDPSWPDCSEPVTVLPGGWLVGAHSDDSVAEWLFDTPQLFRRGVQYAWSRFKPKAVLFAEFGFARWRESQMPLVQARYDDERITFTKGYLDQMRALINVDHVKIIGALGWSSVDNLEWRQGFVSRFGYQYVDFETQQRYYKKSAFFFRDYFHHYVGK